MPSNLFVRNNYFYPPMHHHCHGGNDFMNMMVGFSLIDMMWKNTIASIAPRRPQPLYFESRQQSFYPYTSFSSQSQMSSEDADLIGLRQMYPDCQISKVGNTYFARSQTFAIDASSILELSYKLQDKHNQAIASLQEQAERERIAAEQDVQDPENPDDQPVEEHDIRQDRDSNNLRWKDADDLKSELGEIKYDTISKSGQAALTIAQMYEQKYGGIDVNKLAAIIKAKNPDIFAAGDADILADDAQANWDNLELPLPEDVMLNVYDKNKFTLHSKQTNQKYIFTPEELSGGVDAIVKEYESYLNNLSPAMTLNNKETFKNEIINANKSIFNTDGTLIEGADLSKLRIPQRDYAKKVAKQKHSAVVEKDKQYVVRVLLIDGTGDNVTAVCFAPNGTKITKEYKTEVYMKNNLEANFTDELKKLGFTNCKIKCTSSICEINKDLTTNETYSPEAKYTGIVCIDRKNKILSISTPDGQIHKYEYDGSTFGPNKAEQYRQQLIKQYPQWKNIVLNWDKNTFVQN